MAKSGETNKYGYTHGETKRMLGEALGDIEEINAAMSYPVEESSQDPRRTVRGFREVIEEFQRRYPKRRLDERGKK